MKREIVRRFGHNPILTKHQIPYLVETVHNAAVVKHDGEYIMLFRSHLRTGRSIIGLARSPDGFYFTAASEQKDLPTAEYGNTVTSFEYVYAQLRATDLRLMQFREQGIGHHPVLVPRAVPA